MNGDEPRYIDSFDDLNGQIGGLSPDQVEVRKWAIEIAFKYSGHYGEQLWMARRLTQFALFGVTPHLRKGPPSSSSDEEQR